MILLFLILSFYGSLNKDRRELIKKVEPRQTAESLPMWHLQSKGVSVAIQGCCAQAGGRGYLRQAPEVKKGTEGTDELHPQE